MIIFNGTGSEELHVFVEHFPARPIPKRRADTVTVPGRSGEILIEEDAFENVQQPYDIFLSAEGPGLPRPAAAVARWLCVRGYHKLEDEYDPDVFRLARFAGPVDLENTLNHFGRARIVFDCEPQRYLKNAALPLALTNGQALYNPTANTALPLIGITGSGTGTLTVGGTTVQLDLSGLFGQPLILDCREEDAYTDDGYSVSNFNSAVTGNFPTLPPGASAVSWTGGVSGVKLTPRFYEL